MNAILLDVQQLLRDQFSLTEEQVRPGQKLVDLGIDSLSTIEFMFVLEDKFGISLAESRTKIETVDDVAALVLEAMETKGAIA
jgi:acyl carrier protein